MSRITNGVLFGSKHSYNDFGMILKEKSLPNPNQKRYKVSIIGANGDYDLSTVNTDGEPTYENRTLTFIFDLPVSVNRRMAMYSRISNYLHGRTMQIIVDEDAGYFYVGCCDVVTRKDEMLNCSRIEISVDAEPFKYDKQLSTDEWIWDTFNFETGIIYNSIKNMQITEPTNIVVPFTEGMPVTPSFVTDVPIKVTFRGITSNVPAGIHIVPNVVLTATYHTVRIIPVDDEPATVSLSFRGGML